jgi:hypothetical protein
MRDHSRYWRGDLAPVTAAAAIAMIGIAAFFMHFVPEKDVPPHGIGMVTTTALGKAGAIALPTDPEVQSALRNKSTTFGSSTR